MQRSLSFILLFGLLAVASADDAAVCGEYCGWYLGVCHPLAPNLTLEACQQACLDSSDIGKDGSITDFILTPTAQCRQNHAILAVKTNDFPQLYLQHCYFAGLSGPGRCSMDQAAQEQYGLEQLGRQSFYTPSQVEVSPAGFIPPMSWLVSTRTRLFRPYPYQNIPGGSCDVSTERFRTVDGTCNYPGMPMMGSVNTPFVNQLEASSPHPNGSPDPKIVAEILKRPEGAMAEAWFNQIAAAWTQFMTHDWFVHDNAEPGPTLSNKVTHWWDASQLYGSTPEERARVRAPGGKLHLDGNGEIDYDENGFPITGFRENFWVGLHILHTVFAREHNYLVDQLNVLYPEMTDDECFETARNIQAAAIAKIHTLEWTSTLLDNKVNTFGLASNWYGIVEAANQVFTPEQIAPFQDLLDTLGTNTPNFGGNKTVLSNTSFFMPESFVSAYRFHPVLPDELNVDGKTFTIPQFSLSDPRHIQSGRTSERLFQSLGATRSGALTLNNYPRSLFNLTLKSGDTINLAEIEIIRDRARGMPRYNDARRQLLLQPLASIDELTTNPTWRAMLKEVYTDIDQVDFLVGTLCDEDRPEGFAFGIVAYKIFLVMATRRLMSDRYFQEAFTPASYTNFGMGYVNNLEGLRPIIVRHYPELADVIPANAFMPWEYAEPTDAGAALSAPFFLFFFSLLVSLSFLRWE